MTRSLIKWDEAIDMLLTAGRPLGLQKSPLCPVLILIIVWPPFFTCQPVLHLLKNVPGINNPLFAPCNAPCDYLNHYYAPLRKLIFGKTSRGRPRPPRLAEICAPMSGKERKFWTHFSLLICPLRTLFIFFLRGDAKKYDCAAVKTARSERQFRPRS